jgi:hypothetical protein
MPTSAQLSTLIFGLFAIYFVQINGFFWDDGAFPGSGTITNRFFDW